MKLNKRTYYTLMFLFGLVGFLLSLGNFLLFGMISSSSRSYLCVGQLLVFVLPVLFFMIIRHSLSMLHELVPEEKGQMMEFGKRRLLATLIKLVVLLLLLGWSWVAYCGPPPTPDKCRFTPGIYCVDHRVEMNRTRLLIENGLGKDIILKKLAVTEKSSPPLYLCEMTSGEITIPNGESATITADKCTVTSVTGGKEYKYVMDIIYQHVDSEEEYTVQGELRAKVEGAGEQ